MSLTVEQLGGAPVMGADQAVPVLAWVPWTDGGYHLVEALAGSGRRARCICGRRGLVEAAILVLVLVAFAGLHAVVAQDAAAAAAHAHAVQSLERGLHLDIELTTNRWLAEHEAFIAPAVLLYRLYYAVLLGVLIWVFFGHPDIYLRARRTFVAMTGLALLVFWVLPTSPPRFALPGVVDIIAEHDILATHAGPAAKSSVDLTAMPSLHVGWSAWCAYVMWSAGRASHPRLASLAWLFPLAMAADVLGTGNHYVLDVGGSAVLLAASITLATGWARLVDRRSGATVMT